MRLDIYLQNSNNITRSRAQELIRSKKVCVNGISAKKCGQDVTESDDIVVDISGSYVSRAGQKLEGAFSDFGLSVSGLTILDIGASTGGFCDYCLKNGAKKVYALDVGTNQLDEKIKSNSKVVDMSNTDIRKLNLDTVKDIDAFVCDVSFISLTNISDVLSKLLNIAKFGVVLIKPQFECGKTIAKKCGGVIKDQKYHKLALDSVSHDFEAKGILVKKLTKSKILGKDGNVEFLALIKNN